MRGSGLRGFLIFVIIGLINLSLYMNLVCNFVLFCLFNFLSSFLISFQNLFSDTELELSDIIHPWSLKLKEDYCRINYDKHKKTDINDIVKSNYIS